MRNTAALILLLLLNVPAMAQDSETVSNWDNAGAISQDDVNAAFADASKPVIKKAAPKKASAPTPAPQAAPAKSAPVKSEPKKSAEKKAAPAPSQPKASTRRYEALISPEEKTAMYARANDALKAAATPKPVPAPAPQKQDALAGVKKYLDGQLAEINAAKDAAGKAVNNAIQSVTQGQRETRAAQASAVAAASPLPAPKPAPAPTSLAQNDASNYFARLGTRDAFAPAKTEADEKCTDPAFCGGTKSTLYDQVEFTSDALNKPTEVAEVTVEASLDALLKAPLTYADEIQKHLRVGLRQGRFNCGKAVRRVLEETGLLSKGAQGRERSAKNYISFLSKNGFVNDMNACKRPGVVRIYDGVPPKKRRAYSPGDKHGHAEILGTDGNYYSFYKKNLPINEHMRDGNNRRPLIGCMILPYEVAQTRLDAKQGG